MLLIKGAAVASLGVNALSQRDNDPGLIRRPEKAEQFSGVQGDEVEVARPTSKRL